MLIHMRNGERIAAYPNNKGWVVLENGSRVSPPVLGYVNGNDSIVGFREDVVIELDSPLAVSEMLEVVEDGYLVERTIKRARPFSETVSVLKENIVEEVYKHSDSGIVMNGIAISTDAAAVSDMVGAKQADKISRNVIPRKGAGVHIPEMPKAVFDGLYQAVSDYKQACTDHGVELLRQVDSIAALVDNGVSSEGEGVALLVSIQGSLSDGWPSKELPS